jgi:hypothetical protein
VVENETKSNQLPQDVGKSYNHRKWANVYTTAYLNRKIPESKCWRQKKLQIIGHDCEHRRTCHDMNVSENKAVEGIVNKVEEILKATHAIRISTFGGDKAAAIS